MARQDHGPCSYAAAVVSATTRMDTCVSMASKPSLQKMEQGAAVVHVETDVDEAGRRNERERRENGKESALRKNGRSRTKSVSFNLEANESHSIPPLERGECHARWYNKMEYSIFEAIIAKNAKHIRGQPRRPFSYQHVLEHTDVLCAQAAAHDKDHPSFYYTTFSSDDRRLLNRLLETAPIGLERWAVGRLANHMEGRRKEVVRLVSGAYNEEEVWNKEEALRIQCERVTRPARIFAAALAQALATAVRNESYCDST